MIVIPVVFYVAMRTLIKPMNSPNMPSWFFGLMGPLMVIGFDIAWVIVMKVPFINNIRVKIYLTLLVLTLSASVLACWVLLNLLSGSW
jgi:hypothetical protein